MQQTAETIEFIRSSAESVVIRVSLNKVPKNAIIDSGAGVSIIDSATLAELNI